MRVSRKITYSSTAVAVIVAATFLIASLERLFSPYSNENEFSVALNTSVPLDQLDTKEITDSADYSVLELLLSTLVEYNNQGEIIGGLAERFYWDENRLIFEFREAFFSSGKKVTPEDAIASFKRLMILNKNSHGDLVNLLCVGNRPTRLEDVCEGMAADGNRLILTAQKRTQFLLPMLTSIDYGVLSKESFANPELQVTSFESTSGAYRLERQGETFVLRANEKHWHYNKAIPQVVKIVNFDFDADSENSAQALFLSGKVDFIPTASELRLSSIDKMREAGSREFQVNTTNPMALAYAEFTNVGLALPIETRRKIIARIRKAVSNALVDAPNGRVATLQVLPPSSEGNLSLDQVRTIESELIKYDDMNGLSEIRVAVPEFLVGFYEKALDVRSNGLKIIPYPTAVRFGSRVDSDVPELTVAGVDVTAIEDVNFISYSVKNGILIPPDGQTPTDWLQMYFDTQEKSERMALLQKIQFHTIWENPKIIPISIRPFVSVIDNRWKTDFSKLFPNDPFWKIELK